MLELHVLDTHLYPGCRGTPQGDVPDTDGPCLVVFSDGAVAAGEIGGHGPERRLTVAAYTTGAGTAIAARTWRLAVAGDGFRVTGRLG